ncbi:uncharacterized protein L203_101915 [Cryptococcus depauperatus CBS 7841]|uniref:Ribosome biogenesis protein NSA1 n=1 Tax=Cryptococcus depauperatus CBS 7841 TaxID=1295531 RepID=A0A1E3IHQ6_9TREE|nr:hypothetical protein L203_03159 [Cryptococcus depauperatus CBS 7841]
MVSTLNFLAPSLYPNTLVDVSFAQPTFSGVNVSMADEPVVRHLSVKYGQYQALGGIRRMASCGENRIIAADDKFQVSTLELSPVDAEAVCPPSVILQQTIKARSKDTWAGLVPVEDGAISAISSGLLTHHSISGDSSSRSVSSPLACLASTPLDPTRFALGGKEVDISIWDVERTFGSFDVAMAEHGAKRKKNVLEVGQVWQAKNMPNNYLKLRPPIYHLALSWLDTPDALVSGTKMGTVRRFDTRQRKPVADWKVAREGGVACLVPGAQDELFFSDRSNYLGSLDLRTGKVLYSYSSLTATPHHLVSLPPLDSSPIAPGTKRTGLASISSDASIRIHSSTTPPPKDFKGNWEGEGKKGEIVGLVGGIGLGSFLWRGYGEREVVEMKDKKEDGEERDESENEEEVWKGMDEVQDESMASEFGSDGDEEDGGEDKEESESENEERQASRKKYSR